MSKNFITALLIASGAFASMTLVPQAGAATDNLLHSPVKGVVCDIYFCADDGGVSDALTTKYLGKKKGEQLAAQGDFDRSAFTFANGVYCNTRAHMCRKDRYFGADGKPSGKIDSKTTQWLFAQ